jgi:hypothetical protein
LQGDLETPDGLVEIFIRQIQFSERVVSRWGFLFDGLAKDEVERFVALVRVGHVGFRILADRIFCVTEAGEPRLNWAFLSVRITEGVKTSVIDRRINRLTSQRFNSA